MKPSSKTIVGDIEPTTASSYDRPYDDTFLNYAANTSAPSARRIIAILRAIRPIASVLDVGCARGTWLREWNQAGIGDIYGVDGDYVRPASLLIPRERFTATNLDAGFDLKRSFDLVQSLEVAEHLPEAASRRFVETLVNHSRGIVLFSAALPGQGGEGHVNEQPYEYWRSIFRSFDFHAFDAIRPEIARAKDVSYWYRYNSLLYVHKNFIDKLPPFARATAVPADKTIADVSPVLYRLRRQLVSVLPPWAVKGFSRILAKAHATG